MIEKNILRALVLEAIKREPQTQVNHVVDTVEKSVAELGLFPSKDDCERQHMDYHFYADKQLHPDDRLTISEVIWDLILEHVMVPVGGSPDVGYPQLRLTEFGQDYISQSAPHYHDPEGYIEFLKNIVPNIDTVIEQYIFESLNCYRQQLFFASAVMIGAAAEKAILLLLQAITDSMSDPNRKRKTAQLLEERRSLPDMFKTIRETLDPLIKKKTIPYSVHRGCTEHLMSLFEMIRVQRNDAVHPMAGQVDRTKVFLSLQTIPTALESINKLIEWLRSNSIP
ncbi:hypothetical protein ACFLU9_02625 [Chloroflexota bacterium]